MNLNKTLSEYFNQDMDGRLLEVNRAFHGLYSILSLLKQKRGGNKVLYSTTTCASPVYAASYAGLEPVFADISPKDYLMDENETLSLIEKYKDNLVAVVYIYVFGHTSDAVFRIKDKCKQYGIYLIEDLAQAFGSSIKGIPTGLIGDFAVLSFGHSKQIDAKRGGVIVNNAADILTNKEIKDSLDSLQLVIPSQELSNSYGTNFYANRKRALANDEDFALYRDFIYTYKDLYFSEAPVNWDLIQEKIEYYLKFDITEKRNKIAKEYYDRLKPLSEYIYCPDIKDGYSVYRYTIVLKGDIDLEDFSEYLRQNGINCSNLYIPINRFYGETGCPQANALAHKGVNLWVDPSIANEDYINNTIQQIMKYYGGK